MKKNLLCCITLVLVLQVKNFAQGTGASPDQELIKNLEIQWMTAIAKKDTATLQSMLAKNFELSKIGGHLSTNIKRDKWISNYMEMDWGRFAFKSMQISVDSNLATVNTVLSFRLKPYPFRLSSGVLDIWRKNNGKWQVEKRYLSEDNLSVWLNITEGIGIGLLALFLFRWIRRFFTKLPIEKHSAHS